jgi:excisionase family DNA binding protein
MDSLVQTDIMTIKEVSEYLKLAEKTAYRLAAQGDIPGFKIGGSWRFRKSEIDAWIDKQAKIEKNKKPNVEGLDSGTNQIQTKSD